MKKLESSNNNSKVGILGIGNLLLSDEGFGIHLLQYLQERYIFPEQVTLMDAGTAGIYMAPFMESVQRLIVIDAVDVEAEPGSILFYSGDEVKAGTIPAKMSPHQLGLLDILNICRLRGRAPAAVEYICVVPQSLETGLTLSPVVHDKIAEVTAILLGRLKESGIETMTL